MIAVILQPSYIPWRGYFDQVLRSDLFIFYDDVQYDKHGWRNRNQIKTASGKQWLTIPVHSQGVTGGIPIREVQIDWRTAWPEKHLKAFTSAYAKAPYFKEYLPMLEQLFGRHDACIADFTIEATIRIARELGIHKTRFMRSSELSGIDGRKTERLIQILTRVGADHYISGPSARGYIEGDLFERAGIRLEYMEYHYPEYPQLHPPFDPQVSVLDLLFMTGKDALRYIKPQAGAGNGT